jgi:hypothetical protein
MLRVIAIGEQKAGRETGVAGDSPLATCESQPIT